MSVLAVNCVLSQEVAKYVKLSSHSVIGNVLPTNIIKDSLTQSLNCTSIYCSPYKYNCVDTPVSKTCNIIVQLLENKNICKTPLIQLN